MKKLNLLWLLAAFVLYYSCNEKEKVTPEEGKVKIQFVDSIYTYEPSVHNDNTYWIKSKMYLQVKELNDLSEGISVDLSKVPNINQVELVNNYSITAYIQPIDNSQKIYNNEIYVVFKNKKVENGYLKFFDFDYLMYSKDESHFKINFTEANKLFVMDTEKQQNCKNKMIVANVKVLYNIYDVPGEE